MTHQEMSDKLAEKLLGWHIEGRDDGISQSWIDVATFKLRCTNWHPHTDIAQCFEYIVPAMIERGYEWSMWFNSRNNMITVHEKGEDDAIADSIDNPIIPTAIVEAAYLAIAEKEK